MANWFTADEHFHHKEMIVHCKRPYKKIEEMDNDITQKANDKLNSGDTLWHLGDCVWLGPDRKRYFEKLMDKYRSGVIHHLIIGNHDECKPQFYLNVGFISVHTSFPITIDGIKLMLVHDPSSYYSPDKDVVMLCGHVHLLFKTLPKEKVINVGVDMWDFYPIDMNHIKDIITSKEWLAADAGVSYLEGSKVYQRETR